MAIADDCLRCGEYHPDLGVGGLCPACEDEVEFLDELEAEAAEAARRAAIPCWVQAPLPAPAESAPDG